MKNKIILSALAIIALVSCDPPVDPPVNDQPTNSQAITLKFQPMYDTDALTMARSYITAAGDTIQYAKLKYLLSNFTLEKNDGSLVTLPNIYAYLSLMDGRDSVIIKNVPKKHKLVVSVSDHENNVIKIIIQENSGIKKIILEI